LDPSSYGGLGVGIDAGGDIQMNKDALYPIVFFLLWAERDDPNMMYGSHKIKDVVDNLAKLLHADPQEMRGLLEC
jgi:hypothetical protein